MIPKATAILMKYKREEELNKIIKHLEGFPDIIDEILVFDNSKVNMCGYWRYFGSLNAKNDIIYTQDDDIIVKNIDELYQKYIELKESKKERIVNNMKSGAMKKYKKFGQTMMGWGSFYPKNSIKVLNEYIKEYGIDDLFLRDTSRIYTGLYGKWYSIEAKIHEFPSASDPKSALWLQDKHKINRRESIKRVNYLKGLRK